MKIKGCLIEQYKNATGIKNIDINLPLFETEFNEWLEDSKINSLYIEVLDYMNINYKEDYITSNDNYCYAIASYGKVKIKTYNRF